MARALSDDLRVRVLEAGAVGGSARSVAKRFGIGISTAIRWLRRERENGERVARLRGRALQAYVEHVLDAEPGRYHRAGPSARS
ncbi:IS630 transposase-related protein [Gluconacetobacter asukensis]